MDHVCGKTLCHGESSQCLEGLHREGHPEHHTCGDDKCSSQYEDRTRIESVDDDEGRDQRHHDAEIPQRPREVAHHGPDAHQRDIFFK